MSKTTNDQIAVSLTKASPKLKQRAEKQAKKRGFSTLTAYLLPDIEKKVARDEKA